MSWGFSVYYQNKVPLFTPSLSTQIVHAGATLAYTLPSFSDPEGQPTTLTVTSTLPSFVTYSAYIFTISPPFT